MNKKVDPKLKKFILDIARQAAWNIGVSHYKMDVLYMEEDKEVNCEHDIVAASIEVNRRYLNATMKVYPYLVKKWEAGEKKIIADCITHEMAHIATAHLHDCATSTYIEEGEMKDAWESLTEMIGRMSRHIDKLIIKK